MANNTGFLATTMMYPSSGQVLNPSTFVPAPVNGSGTVTIGGGGDGNWSGWQYPVTVGTPLQPGQVFQTGYFQPVFQPLQILPIEAGDVVVWLAHLGVKSARVRVVRDEQEYSVLVIRPGDVQEFNYVYTLTKAQVARRFYRAWRKRFPTTPVDLEQARQLAL